LARDTTDVFVLHEEVTRAWGATISTEATHTEVVHAAAAAVRERAETSMKEAEAWVTLAEWKDREWVSKMEVEGVALLAFVRWEADEFTRKVVLLEGDLTDAHRAWNMAKLGEFPWIVGQSSRRRPVVRRCREAVPSLGPRAYPSANQGV
jgi:hypothetical protein